MQIDREHGGVPNNIPSTQRGDLSNNDSGKEQLASNKGGDRQNTDGDGKPVDYYFDSDWYYENKDPQGR